ncbi:MAG: ADP-ribosylglycohydrolase family protein [Gemmatimonadales bacterium]|nr:ADP-ribosylglycohydrolase family protein [Gemmatimonadales bacterium]MDZ4388731.1 ADP-ribosylglycohydrolase family protein [Gemmatimonadales bacterium]
MNDHLATTGPSPQARIAGFLAGAPIGAALAARTYGLTDPESILAALAGAAGVTPLTPPVGRRPAAIALSDGLLEELVSGGVDLRRLAKRWVTWYAEDGLGADPALIEGLSHLRDFEAPPVALTAHGPAPLAAVLPAALTAGAPRTMLAGALHTARMLDPDEATGLAAVAVVVAASRLLQGYRDFIPDVVSVLRVNEAPPAMLDRFLAITRDPRSVPPVPRGVLPQPVDVAVWALWLAHHRPRSAEVLEAMVRGGGIAPVAGAVAGALLGARDGLDGWPAEWSSGAGEAVPLRSALAARLAAQLPLAPRASPTN